MLLVYLNRGKNEEKLFFFLNSVRDFRIILNKRSGKLTMFSCGVAQSTP